MRVCEDARELESLTMLLVLAWPSVLALPKEKPLLCAVVV